MGNQVSTIINYQQRGLFILQLCKASGSLKCLESAISKRHTRLAILSSCLLTFSCNICAAEVSSAIKSWCQGTKCWEMGELHGLRLWALLSHLSWKFLRTLRITYIYISSYILYIYNQNTPPVASGLLKLTANAQLPHQQVVLVDHGKTWLAVRCDWTHHWRYYVLQLLGLAVSSCGGSDGPQFRPRSCYFNGKIWENDDRLDIYIYYAIKT